MGGGWVVSGRGWVVGRVSVWMERLMVGWMRGWNPAHTRTRLARKCRAHVRCRKAGAAQRQGPGLDPRQEALAGPGKQSQEPGGVKPTRPSLAPQQPHFREGVKRISSEIEIAPSPGTATLLIKHLPRSPHGRSPGATQPAESHQE